MGSHKVFDSISCIHLHRIYSVGGPKLSDGLRKRVSYATEI